MLEGSILQKLEVSHRHSDQPLKLGVYYKNTLVSLCHALEDHILHDDSQPLILTAFQQGKWYLQEAERYAEVAQKSSQVGIMATSDSTWAEHPTSQLANVNLVSLDHSDPVAQEWHLIIFSSKYTAMVLCQELSESDYGVGGRPQSDLERKFYGLWTFEPELVKETVQLVIAHIKKYQPELANQLTAHLQTIQPQSATPEELGTVVARVVDYLKTEEKNTQPKSLDRNLISNEIQAFLRMAQIMDAADITNPMAAAEVMTLSETMAQMLELPAWQIKRLRLAGLLHRIDPLQRTESVLESTSTYQSDIPQVPPSCPLVPGTQVLRTMPRLRAIAQIITHQTECWDGSGKPAGLVGDEIPLESRILALAAEFQYRVNQQKKSRSNPEEIVTQALEECKQQSHHFDPKLLETLTLLVMGLQQGMELTVKIPKVSSNMWLLDEPLASNLMGEPINSSQS
ncbi:DICT sensory domain-containing protein [Calothrix rhizosoleniae]|uniref:DICT sensory domain-containing protein n=1 Tax=Calothrix rhizosoleniae TaxID=888997 RepID=UPI000B4A1746|nr:DICT sensory domain-containing protein [Calothrix rhizosoleniae]